MMKSRDIIQDSLLVVRCQVGEEAALGELYQRYNKRFLSFAGRFVGNPDTGADIVQEAWMTIIKRIRRLDDANLFRAWAYRIVTNKCLDHGRGIQKERKMAEALMAEAKTSEPGNLSAVPDALLTRLTLRELMNRMPPERRSLLILFYVEGLSLHELACVFGIAEGTIKSRLHHAREALKAAYEQPELEREIS